MEFIKPNWSAPKNVVAYTTTRRSGHSKNNFASFNLANHVGDEPEDVAKNRALLAKTLSLPSEPIWLNQVHSERVVTINDQESAVAPTVDAAITEAVGKVCVVMTADCLPILICNKEGTKVSAIHAGWRGLLSGIIENTIAQFNEPLDSLIAWLGPAIGPEAFEVSTDVLQPFLTKDEGTILAFKEKPGVKNKWLANIYLLARMRLQGVNAVYGGEYCTYSNEKNFYSYRRDHGITGRMATLIWRCA